MSFVKNNSHQVSFGDSTHTLSERNQRILKKSWAERFSKTVFPLINEERFAVLYSDNPATRPNTPVNVNVGMLMLKQMFDHTDDDLAETLLFDVRYQHALHTTSYEEQPVSDRTLSRFRERLYEYEKQTGRDLLKEEMESLAEAFASMMKISGLMKRMDSLMVSSSCKKMSRLELMYRCVRNMAKAVESTGETALLEGRLKKYLDEDDENDTLYRAPASETGSRLETAMADAVRLLSLAEGPYRELPEYQQLQRMVSEQTEETGSGRRLRESVDVSPESLQNPSDEDATYRQKAGKKYKGYVGNIVETFDEHGAIITQMDYQPNTHSDLAFGAAVVEAAEKTGSPVTIIADGAYGCDRTVNPTEESPVTLVTTALTGKPPNPMVNSYEFDEQEKTIIRCPAGEAPIASRYHTKTDSIRAKFDKGTCSNCPHREHCGVRFQKKDAVVQISRKTIRRAGYLNRLGEPVYRALARLRNAVEGIPSVLRRKYQVDSMPVRGYLRSKMWFFTKVGSINVKRVIRWAQ